MNLPRANQLSRLAAIPLAPILIAQERKLRRDIPRLPDAAKPWSGELAGSNPVRLLVLGDSTAAGVGADTQDDALPGNLARAILARYHRGTRWSAAGRNGATARDLLTDFIEPATSEEFDLVFLTIGANDALAIRSRRAFSANVAELVGRLRQASPNALILVSLMPRFDRFASLVNPSRWNLALHASNLDDGARHAVRQMADVFTMPKPPPYSAEFWASDGFHPGPEGYREWVDFALDAVPEALLDRHLGAQGHSAR